MVPRVHAHHLCQAVDVKRVVAPAVHTRGGRGAGRGGVLDLAWAVRRCAVLLQVFTFPLSLPLRIGFLIFD